MGVWEQIFLFQVKPDYYRSFKMASWGKTKEKKMDCETCGRRCDYTMNVGRF